MKRTIDDVNLSGKRVLLRVDFNVPLDDNGNILDDKRIVEALPTIKHLLSQNARVIICSHLGRPTKIDKKYSLKYVSEHLSTLLSVRVLFSKDVVGPDAQQKAADLKDGQVLVLENLRFEEGEEKNDLKFAKKLAGLAQFYVNDAFGTAHRKHASTYTVASLLPNALGYLMSKEINIISSTLNNPKKPFVAVIGGVKVSDKIGIIKNLVEKVDTLLIGGAMAFTFLKVLGFKTGRSIVEEDKMPQAKQIIELALMHNTELCFPTDFVCAEKIDENIKAIYVKNRNIPDELMGLDIGKKTAKFYAKKIAKSKTVIWNGPMGVFEINKFAKGTHILAKGFAKSKAVTIIGGGDSIAAINAIGLAHKMTHISTGGGASLKLLEGSTLPCVEIINDKE